MTVGAPRTLQPSPSILFCFQLLLRRRKSSALSIQQCCSPNASFVGPFFSLFALFLVKSSWQALVILIHAQTTLTCVFVLWLRYRPTLNSIRQTDVDTLMIRTQSRVRVRVRVRVIYLNQTGIRHQILGGVGVRVMHSRSDAPNPNPTHSILNCFFP